MSGAANAGRPTDVTTTETTPASTRHPPRARSNTTRVYGGGRRTPQPRAAGVQVYVARSWRGAESAGRRYPWPVSEAVEFTGEACQSTAGEPGATRLTRSGPLPVPGQIP